MCKSGLPCGSPSSSLLPTWLLIKAPAESVNSPGGGSISFSNLLQTAHLKAQERRVIWPLASSNSYSFREPQEVFPALLPAFLI